MILWPEKPEFEPGGGLPGAARRSPHTALMSQAREPDRTSRVQKAMMATWLSQPNRAISVPLTRRRPVNYGAQRLSENPGQRP